MTFTPTEEQTFGIDCAKTGENVLVEAGAGTGKTTLLKAISRELPDKRLTYVAYNKSVQLEAAASFPRNTRCVTGHALAFRAVGKDYKHRLQGPRVTARQTAGILGIRESFPISADMVLKPWQIARLVMDTVKRYSYSDVPRIERRHVPWLAGTEQVRDELCDFILPFALRAWADIIDPNGRLKFEHDHYVKIWALGDPIINVDVIEYDEAQDANPVLEGVIRRQDCQKIYVGDRCQAIYGWRGAQDAMSKFAADHHCTLSQSFRFGPAVAEEANKWLDVLDGPLRLKGFDKIDSILCPIENPDTILCRTNATVVAEAMAAQAQDKAVAIVGGTAEIKRFADAAADLKAGNGTAHQDLTAFQNWAQVQDYVNNDEGGKDLKVFVKLIDTYGVPAVQNVAEQAVEEADADIIVSTAHKSKGREWHKVRIANDFSEPEGDKIPPAEAMLAYVSVTRAQYGLDNAGLQWIDNWQTAAQVEA